MTRKPLILVSNDDGVQAKGLKILARALKGLGRVIVVAPDQQRSACSHSITLHLPLRINKLAKDIYSVSGTPTDCIMLALNEILDEKPDLIVSGINHGPNIGDDVHYSGTVSAAYEGGIEGIPSIAMSLLFKNGKHFKSAAEFAKRVSKKVLKEGLPRGVILNVNVPDLPEKEILGYKITKQGKRNYGDIIVDKVDPKGRKYYWIGGDQNGFEDIPSSDCNAVREDYISITPLRVDITDKPTLKKLSSWNI
ncbi:MAG: 5'/3'-nucleotidase SurE [Deltaproteobacteria bacterium]|jgi:5'-nucleotidase|nr:5'/3'-nucleotidase SurE [Deltaproteobacteria bacterium]